MVERVEVRQGVLKENDRIAGGTARRSRRPRTLCLNLISSPGAGKTSILEGTLEALAGHPAQVAVLTGDIQTERDADRLRRYRLPCASDHDRRDVPPRREHGQRALTTCRSTPSTSCSSRTWATSCARPSYDLGEDAKVVVLSVTEGDDKPLKYPGIFRRARLMLLHKIDLLPYTRFNRDAAVDDARRVNPEIEIVETSCLAEPGLGAWLRWLENQLDGQANGGPTGPCLEASTTAAARAAAARGAAARPPAGARETDDDTRFSRSWLLHFGQPGVRVPTTSASNS